MTNDQDDLQTKRDAFSQLTEAFTEALYAAADIGRFDLFARVLDIAIQIRLTDPADDNLLTNPEYPPQLASGSGLTAGMEPKMADVARPLVRIIRAALQGTDKVTCYCVLGTVLGATVGREKFHDLDATLDLVRDFAESAMER
jgi:hypothetical protein